MSRGTAGFKPAASDQFRHPGSGAPSVSGSAAYVRPGSSESGAKRSGPKNWYAARNASKAF